MRRIRCPGAHVITASVLSSMIRMGVMFMARLAIAIVIVAASLLVTSGTTTATTLYWTPAHELAPQGGHYGAVVACDLDGDGDQDVSFVNSGEAPGQNAQFWNIGTAQTPEWQIDMDVVPALIGCWERKGAYGDIDADGDFDLVSGCLQPGLYLHRNVGTPQAPQWVDDSAVVQGITSNWQAEPCLADIDADGDLDLVIATSGGSGAFLYRNVGTPQIPQWTHPGSKLPGATVSGAVRLGDLDLDGDLDMVGRASGSVGCWENIGTPQSPAFAYNPGMLIGVTPGFVLSMELLDIDGDGDLDLLIMDGHQAYLFLNEAVTAAQQSSWGTIKAMYR